MIGTALDGPVDVQPNPSTISLSNQDPGEANGYRVGETHGLSNQWDAKMRRSSLANAYIFSSTNF
ncbi:hypothetical protein MJO29_014380 [Puccinia striiformis f. sp. tritici]|nr:hypothetical protein MJO29_014380 [Puccinia striiformis f. sp. tritici]